MTTMLASPLLSTEASQLMTLDKSNSRNKMPYHETRRSPRVGDVVTVDFVLAPEGDFVPHPLFDTNGLISFVLGWGNYLPGLHDLVSTMRPGESRKNVSIDAGWGERNSDLVVRIPRKRGMNLRGLDHDTVEVGAEITLDAASGIIVQVTQVTENFIEVDANPPLAGSSYRCDLTLVSVDSAPDLRGRQQESRDDDDSSHSNVATHSKYEVATFALGCFWGGELAYTRTPGVVGTRVGYTQGRTSNPTYEKVCEGTTNHVEAIMVVYDPSEVSYQRLLLIALERLAATDGGGGRSSNMDINQKLDLDEWNQAQYRHGIYFHSRGQRDEAVRLLHHLSDPSTRDARLGRWAEVFEVKPATTFYNAEEYHQQYLLKGGQNARKGAKETIRCFG